MKMLRCLLIALACLGAPAHAVTFDFSATSTVVFTDATGLINPPVGQTTPFGGSLTLQETGAGTVATLDLGTALGTIDSTQSFNVALTGGTPPTSYTSTGPGAFTGAGLIATDGTNTLNFAPTGNDRIDIGGMFMNGQASVAHFAIWTIQVFLDLRDSGTGRTLGAVETFTLSGVSVTNDTSSVPAVPLPATAPLLVAGLGAVVLMRRRKQHPAAS